MGGLLSGWSFLRDSTVVKGLFLGGLQKVVQLMGAAITPLLSSLSDALEAIILTMHQEDFSG